jgi:hypothetical protein
MCAALASSPKNSALCQCVHFWQQPNAWSSSCILPGWNWLRSAWTAPSRWTQRKVKRSGASSVVGFRAADRVRRAPDPIAFQGTPAVQGKTAARFTQLAIAW